MGAWGYGPFDNDDAGDWMFDVERAISGPIQVARDQDDEDIKAGRVAPEIWHRGYAAAAIVAALAEQGWGHGSIYEDAELALENMLADEDFVASWKKPQQFIATVSAYIDALDRLKRADRARLRRLRGPKGGRRK
jgi:hypothetical protein